MGVNGGEREREGGGKERERGDVGEDKRAGRRVENADWRRQTASVRKAAYFTVCM